ncbi:MAG: type II toxin-antitoxin system RelE/ParE family toxin [Desulfobacterales bacterium]|nr:MAG: type II toxin-antitoxin system RelE/ParE family toxin [Desulfobacterales bacterium]
MARKVIWANAAAADLDAAADYISKDSQAYAASFVLQLLEAAQSLGDLSERGRAVPEFKREDIREIFVFNYRLIYRIDQLQVSILAPIHGRRDFGQAWDERKR